MAPNLDPKTLWLNRHVRKQTPWLMNHVLLNNHINNLFALKERDLWQKFTSNKTRLLNIVYTCVNKHIPHAAIAGYRKAVK